jgi:hypothetical protein
MPGLVGTSGREGSESFTLKPITKAAIPRALEKAERYRLLNEPSQAESICLDILAAEPDNQQALISLVLSVTDRFGSAGAPGLHVAREAVGRLEDPYQRDYYEGLIRERDARARLGRPMGSSFAYEGLRAAMACYERAIASSPADDNDAILRWNACVRTIQQGHLQPRPAEVEQPLE